MLAGKGVRANSRALALAKTFRRYRIVTTRCTVASIAASRSCAVPTQERVKEIGDPTPSIASSRSAARARHRRKTSRP